MHKLRTVWDTNRSVSMAARKRKSWCDGCDACYTNVGAKCPSCGYRPAQPRLKKENDRCLTDADC